MPRYSPELSTQRVPNVFFFSFCLKKRGAMRGTSKKNFVERPMQGSNLRPQDDLHSSVIRSGVRSLALYPTEPIGRARTPDEPGYAQGMENENCERYIIDY